MALQRWRFLALLFTALAMAPALAHVLELPNKIGLPQAEYRIVQQIYRGWALLGIVVVGALLSTLILTVLLRQQRRPFIPSLIAFLCIVGTQVVFWTCTYPTNQETQNWMILPEHWLTLRSRWEYSHAVGAGLNFIAFVTLVLSMLGPSEPTHRRSDQRA